MSNIHEVNVTDENLYLELWQYDAGQRLKFVETSIEDGSHVLFANSETRKAIRKEVANNEVGIPNKFLRATGKMHITIETFNENEETTLYEINGYIKRRQDGEPGTAPDDEPTFIQKIIKAIEELQDKVANWFYTKDEVDDKDTLTLDTAKNYTDGVAEDLDQAKEDKFTVEGHLSKEDRTLTSDSCKVYKYKYTFNKSAYPGIKEGDLIYNYTNINALFRSDLYYIEDASGSVLQYREINGDAIRVFKSTDNPPTESNSGYNPGDIWQKYSSPTFHIGTLTDVFLCVAQVGGIMPAAVKWVRLVEDSYSKDEIDDILLDFGNGISCSIDPLTYVCTFQLKNGDSVVSSASIDLPLETMVLDVDYDSQTKELVITLKNETVRRVDVSAIVSGLVTVQDFEDAISDIEDALDEKEDKINASHKINADFLDDSTSTKKTVTQQEKDAWSGKQDAIGPNNKVSADNIDDTSSTNKLTTQAEKDGWDAKEDPTNIEKDSTSTTVSLTLENNTENRYTEDLTDLTIALPQTIDDDFISGVVFASGTIPTAMTYDSSIKWTGDDVNNNVFVPAADKTYNFIIWNDGININAIVRGVA